MEEQANTQVNEQTKKPLFGLSKKIIAVILGLLVVVLVSTVVVVYVLVKNDDSDNENLDTENEVTTTTKIFTSSKGSFSVELPNDQNIIMTELAETTEDGFTKADVVFTFGAYKEAEDGQESPAQFVITYSKPSIDGKGGSCIPEGFTQEVILEQEVSVCESDASFSASYFKHPTKQIEYDIQTINLTAAQKEIFANAVRDSLKFN